MHALVWVIALVVVGSVLYYKRKHKPSPEELARRAHLRHEYILSQIQLAQQDTHAAHQGRHNLITSLPMFQRTLS